jgi:hypothetical protein
MTWVVIIANAVQSLLGKASLVLLLTSLPARHNKIYINLYSCAEDEEETSFTIVADLVRKVAPPDNLWAKERPLDFVCFVVLGSFWILLHIGETFLEVPFCVLAYLGPSPHSRAGISLDHVCGLGWNKQSWEDVEQNNEHVVGRQQQKYMYVDVDETEDGAVSLGEVAASLERAGLVD